METVGLLGVVTGMIARFWPVWLALALLLVGVWRFKKGLGLFGHLFDSGVGAAGVAICCFWLFTALFAHIIAPLDPRIQVAIMKNAVPGAINPETGMVFLLGGDQLARDVFSRAVYGARIVLTIAPAATLIALLVGVTLGAPAGSAGRRGEHALSCLPRRLRAPR